MTTATLTVEAIYSFTDSDQLFQQLEVPLTDAGVSEAALLRAALDWLPAELDSDLAKVSFCLFGIESEEHARNVAPWIFCSDSPLFNGKLWLKQHAS